MRKQDTATQLQEQFLNNSHITIFLQARNCFSECIGRWFFIWKSIAHCIKYITLYTTRLRMLEYFFSISLFQKSILKAKVASKTVWVILLLQIDFSQCETHVPNNQQIVLDIVDKIAVLFFRTNWKYVSSYYLSDKKVVLSTFYKKQTLACCLPIRSSIFSKDMQESML